jgi:hypothetical protein
MDFSANDPELDGKFLGTISSDFVKVADQIKEASYQMRVRRISDYPVFVLCKNEQPIGSLLYDKWAQQLDWHYYVAMAEELVQRKIFTLESYTHFTSGYKNADEFCCLLVVDPSFTGFVYLPYPED